MSAPPLRPANLKKWPRDKSRGCKLSAWFHVGVEIEGKQELWAWRLRFAPNMHRTSELIRARGWREAYRKAEDILAGRGGSGGPHPHGQGDGGLTMAEVFEDCMKVKASDNSATRLRTVDCYRREWAISIGPTFDERPIKTIGPEDVTRWMASKDFTHSHRPTKKGAVRKAAKSRTRFKRLALLQLVMKWALKRSLVHRLPFDDSHVVLTKAKGKFVADRREGADVALDEVTRAVAWLDERDADDPIFGDPVPRMAIEVAAYAGLRLRELIHVREEDVSLDGRFIEVVSDRACPCRHCASDGKVWRTKNALDRLVPVAPELAPRLAAYLVRRQALPGDASGVRFLFPVWRARLKSKARPGAQRRSESLTKQWQRAAREALGRTDVVLHDLRRTAYRLFYDRSGKELWVKLVMGHTLDALQAAYLKVPSEREVYYRMIFPSEKAPTGAASMKKKLRRSRQVA
jgi:Phage integrase family